MYTASYFSPEGEGSCGASKMIHTLYMPTTKAYTICLAIAISYFEKETQLHHSYIVCGGQTSTKFSTFTHRQRRTRNCVKKERERASVCISHFPPPQDVIVKLPLPLPLSLSLSLSFSLALNVLSFFEFFWGGRNIFAARGSVAPAVGRRDLEFRQSYFRQ